MATFSHTAEFKGAEFIDADLRGAGFVEVDLSGVVMRGVEVRGDIDAPWLSNGESFLRINGVDMIPSVEAELNRRFPGRANRRATGPDGLRGSGPRSSEPGRPPWSASRRCLRARSICRWAGSGRSRRRCGT